MTIRWNSAGGVLGVSKDEKKGVRVTVVGGRFSNAGSIISLVCAVHCALTPLVVLVLPLLAVQYGGAMDVVFGVMFSHSFEWVFLGVIVVIAGFGVLATYPVHGDGRPATLTVIGFMTLLSVRLLVEQGSTLEITGDLLGASMIAWGGFLNRSLCRCRGCHEDGAAGGEPSPIPASAGS